MSERTEQHDQNSQQYAKIADALVPHGWEQKYANGWRKKEGRKVATVVVGQNGEIHGSGYLPFLIEAGEILKSRGLLPNNS